TTNCASNPLTSICPKLQSEVIGQMEVRGFEAQFVVDHVAPQRPSVSVVGKHPDLSSLDHDSRLPTQIPEQRASAARPRGLGRRGPRCHGLAGATDAVAWPN